MQFAITELRNANQAAMNSIRRERWRIASHMFNQTGGCRRDPVAQIGSGPKRHPSL